MKPWTRALGLAALTLAAACSDDGTTPVEPLPTDSVGLRVTGLGEVRDRLTSELWVRGEWAYTGTYGSSSRGPGDRLKVWNVAGPEPVLRHEVVVPGATTLGDVQVSDDGRLLVVATEFVPGSIVVYDLEDPERPRQIARHATASTRPGVHTATLARVDGRLYAFLAVDLLPSQLVIVDLEDPADPREVWVREMGTPFIHDVFVRDGILFTALWNAGVEMWDVGGGGQGGSASEPVRMGTLETRGGQAHNVWWGGRASAAVSPRYVFVGQEGPGSIGTGASGDVHVVDIADPDDPREVAFFTLPGAGAHNFAVDEASGVLYAAFYNGGIQALDVRGDLSACTPDQREPAGERCDLWKMGRLLATGLAAGPRPVYVWGVHWQDGRLWPSDMLNGLWPLDASDLRR